MMDRTGYLTIYTPDKTEILGEFADADWKSEATAVGKNTIFSGTAGEGALAAFQQLNEDGISHVYYTFESDGQTYSGAAELLAPIDHNGHGQGLIRIETG